MRLIVLLLLPMLVSTVEAGPWLDPGDTGLRNDLQLLADGGVIDTPMTAWPLSWGDISPQLQDPGNLSDAETAALARVRAKARQATVTGQWQPQLEAAAGSDARLIRDLEDLPREEGEISAGLQWTGDRLALNLVGQSRQAQLDLGQLDDGIYDSLKGRSRLVNRDRLAVTE